MSAWIAGPSGQFHNMAQVLIARPLSNGQLDLTYGQNLTYHEHFQDHGTMMGWLYAAIGYTEHGPEREELEDEES